MVIAIICIVLTYLLGLSLAIKNLKRDKSKEIEARREAKKRINEIRKRNLNL